MWREKMLVWLYIKYPFWKDLCVCVNNGWWKNEWTNEWIFAELHRKQNGRVAPHCRANWDFYGWFFFFMRIYSSLLTPCPITTPTYSWSMVVVVVIVAVTIIVVIAFVDKCFYLVQLLFCCCCSCYFTHLQFFFVFVWKKPRFSSNKVNKYHLNCTNGRYFLYKYGTGVCTTKP